MLDTVILTIPRYKFETPKTGAGIAYWDLNARTSNYEKYVKNQPHNSKNKKGYMPRLTGINMRISGGIKSFLKIEFSAPKLLYQNNLQELEDADFPKIVSILQEKLLDMGVVVSLNEIENAAVSGFHPSKNVILSDGYTATFVIKELSKINLNKKFDLNKANFRNNGLALQGYTQSHSIVFYDKIADLNPSQKRPIDTDQTFQQLSLFAEIKKESPLLEILRMEIRLSRKQKLSSIMRKLGYSENPRFQDIFRKDVCQKIISFYWDSIVKNENLFLFGLNSKPDELLREVLRKHQKMKLRRAVYLVGLSLLCRANGGIRELREIGSKYISSRSWPRIVTDTRLLNEVSDKRRIHDWVKQIEKSITQFQSIKIQI